MSRLIEQISVVAPLAGVLDGTPQVAPKLAKARADGSPVATQWQCPYCSRYGRSYVENLEHIALEARFAIAEMPDELRAKYTKPKGSSKPRAVSRIKLADGRVRYRFVVDVGKKPDGKRDQRTFTYDLVEEAIAERARIIDQVRAGTYVPLPKPWQRVTLRCVGRTRAGDRCQQWPVLGSNRCRHHPEGQEILR